LTFSFLRVPLEGWYKENTLEINDVSFTTYADIDVSVAHCVDFFGPVDFGSTGQRRGVGRRIRRNGRTKCLRSKSR
jgi:hypothetical protein